MLAEMISLYKDGWSSVMLGRKYGCDHTSILAQVKKAGISISRHRKRIYIKIQPIITYKPEKYDHLIDEPCNPGKTYREYLEDARLKKEKSSPISHLFTTK